MAAMRSATTARRSAKATPWSASSSTFQPNPMPKTKRPPDTRSSEATSLAVMMGSRWATRAMPVPTRRCSVTAAAAVSVTKGSSERLYSSANGSPAGAGVARLVGMWVCSGT